MKLKFYSIFLLLLVTTSSLLAQTTITTETGTTGYTGTNGVAGNSCITFVVSNTNSSAIILDEVSDFKNPTNPGSTASFTLWYSSSNMSGSDTIASPKWTQIATTSTPLSLTNGYNTIFTNLNFQIPSNTQYRFALQSDNGIAYSGTAAGQCTPSILSADGVDLILGDAQINGSYVGYGGAFPTPTNNPRWFTGSITFSPALPCTTPPAAGTATSSTVNGCIGSNFTLNLTGSSQGTGLTYQWDSSSNGTTWFPIAGAIKRSFTKTQISSTYYRCRVTCSGNTATSTSIFVNTPAPVSGTFTINSSLPTGGLNFQTFNDAISYINCGIGGPVVFNVTPGSGPYNEQITIPQIGGASSTNTIKINGNGETISYGSTNTNNRAVITLNGADYITIDSLIIDATSGTYGWGILLTNSADNNTITKCTINSSISSTSNNFQGILINGSQSATAGSGNNGNYNIITNNTFNGGYYAVYIYGNTTNPNQNVGNIVSNNTINDMYSYGIYLSYLSNTIISKNNVYRPTRTNSTTTGGVFLTTGCIATLVEKNKVHNLFDALLTSTATTYSFYDAADGKAGFENKFYNNVAYNMNGNGTIYGFYNTGADSVKIYHNTFVFDDPNTTTGNAYGFYQTGAATGIDFRNNIIFLNRGGTGIKRAIQFATITSDITSNNNVFYFAPSSGTNNNFGQIATSNFLTFADWKLANSNTYDQLSVETDPFFNAPSTGDLQPSIALINDIGANLGVTTDISGVTRTNTPDPGAYEFSPAPCTAPPAAGIVVAPTTVCSGNNFSVTLNGNSSGLGQTYTWEKSANGTTGWTTVFPASTNPTIITSQTTSYYYRCGVKCGTGATVYTPTQLITTPSLVSGTFTINGNLPTGGANFQSFPEAINYIGCGISGPVVFNVAPGSGPYTDKITIPAINGTSATKTITFNGNGASIFYTAPDAANRTAITLNGADHIILDSLTIDVSNGSTAGWAIVLMNQADSNTVKRCNIINNTTSTSSNYAGILINGSNSTTAASGNNGNYNTITNNTITGGYYSFYIYGNTANTNQNVGNIISKNILYDFYSYAIFAGYQSSGFKITGNNISRPTRANSTTTAGIYLTTGNIGALVEKNRIHNMFDGNGISTSTFYGVYVSADAKPNFENKIINNLIYNINSNGTAYGIYNAGGDSMQVYHNTIVLDDASTTTGAAYGLYQTTAANGIVYKNNIVYITRNGTGIKRCIYFVTTTSSIVSNNNVLFLSSSSGTNNNVGQFGTTNYATLADWKTANSNAYDQLSLNIDPVLSNPNPDDYIPTNGAINGVGANVGVTTDINGNARGTTPDPGAFEIAVTGCINPPSPGGAVASVTSVCPSVSFSLSLSGNTSGTGQTYQWQVSTNNSNWSNIGVASASSSYTTSQLATRYYRAAITCNAGTTVYSASVQVLTPTSLSGNYTINNAQPTSSTNFQSFTEALNTISCAGVAGAITLNVTPGSGPYNERIIIPQIAGITSANKLTINGNGAILNYVTTDANNRAAIILNGADNIVIDSLNIDVSQGTYGWGIVLTAKADSNIIRNCTITTDINSTTTNYGGIFINGSTSATGGSGNNGNNNLITGNTINGGYYGIYLYGSTTSTVQNVNNQIIKNIINDVYTYSIYATYQSTGLVISKNSMSRENRTNSGTCAGVYLTTGCLGAVIEKNRIQNMFDAQLSSTATFYGIYVGAKGKAGQETKVVNNVISNISGNGIVYGIYNSTGDTMQAYHNTVVIDDITSASGSAYGFYQTGSASGIDFRNNIISITRGGTGLKRCMYFVTNTSSIRSNNNVLYMNAGGGTNNHVGQFGTTNFTTLADWKTANTNSYDQNSVSVNPTFTGTANGDYIPSAIQCDNIGANLNVTTDILEGARSLTTPDAGAFEFVGSILVPINLASFTGEKKANSNLLLWSTATELNNSGFELQRSANGRDFSKLSFIASKAENGTSNAIISYSYEDRNPLATTNYYRLKQIDKNGQNSYSKIVSLAGNKNDKFQIVNLYPNPAFNQVNLNVNTSKDEVVTIIVTDIVGKILIKQNASIRKGENTISLNTEKLANGTYTVKLISSNFNETAVSKFSKQ